MILFLTMTREFRNIFVYGEGKIENIEIRFDINVFVIISSLPFLLHQNTVQTKLCLLK